MELWTTGARDSLGAPAANPLEAVPISLALAAFSLLVVGWITAPAGAVGGALLALLFRGVRSRREG